MGSQTQKKFTWVLQNFSQDQTYCSRHFVFSGCNWRLCAETIRYRNEDYLALDLEVLPSANLRSGWRRNVEFYITLVNMGGKSNKELGDEHCFDAKNNSCGFPHFLSIYKLRDRRRGFMVNNKLTIEAELHVRAVSPLKTLSFKEGNRGSDENLDYDDYDSSEESVMDYDDDDQSEESATDDDDDASEESDSDDDDDDDDASEESDTDTDDDDDDDDDDDGVDDNDEDVSEKSLDDCDDASLDYGGKGFYSVARMNVNGFQVISSKVETVKLIFERHPDITVGFSAKNQHLRNACMNFLLSLIETMCQPLHELSHEDLVEADIALTYFKYAGFKVDWLEQKLEQLKESKETEKSGLVRLQEIEEGLMKLKQKVSEMDALAEKEKEELSATRAPMSFDDLV